MSLVKGRPLKSINTATLSATTTTFFIAEAIVQKIFRATSSPHPWSYSRQESIKKVCSADTLLRGIRELATENKVFVSKQGKSYNFNINEKPNNLNIKSLLLTGQLKAGESYDLDYDNQLIANEKHDAKLSYKKLMGAIFPALPQLAIKLSRWKTETVMPTWNLNKQRPF